MKPCDTSLMNTSTANSNSAGLVMMTLAVSHCPSSCTDGAVQSCHVNVPYSVDPPSLATSVASGSRVYDIVP